MADWMAVHAGAAAAVAAAPGIWSSCAFAIIGAVFVLGELLTLTLGNQKGLNSPNRWWVLLLVRSCTFSRAGAAGAGGSGAGGGVVVVVVLALVVVAGPPPNHRAAAAPPGWHVVRGAMAGSCSHRCMVGWRRGCVGGRGTRLMGAVTPIYSWVTEK